jgi:hypothetical protein
MAGQDHLPALEVPAVRAAQIVGVVRNLAGKTADPTGVRSEGNVRGQPTVIQVHVVSVDGGAQFLRQEVGQLRPNVAHHDERIQS